MQYLGIDAGIALVFTIVLIGLVIMQQVSYAHMSLCRFMDVRAKKSHCRTWFCCKHDWTLVDGLLEA